MTEIYSFKDVASVFDQSEARLRYWAQSGLVVPSVRRGGRRYFNFQDLISVKTAVGLLDAGLSVRRVRKNLAALRRSLPEVAHPIAQLRISCDGDTVIAEHEGVTHQGDRVWLYDPRDDTVEQAELVRAHLQAAADDGSLTAWVDPRAPERAVLINEVNWWHSPWPCIFVLLCLGAGVMLMFRALRPKLAARVAAPPDENA